MTYKPSFPTILHQDILRQNWCTDYFLTMSNVDTVLVVNSCARGQAVPFESEPFDFAILIKLETTPTRN